MKKIKLYVMNIIKIIISKIGGIIALHVIQKKPVFVFWWNSCGTSWYNDCTLFSYFA